MTFYTINPLNLYLEQDNRLISLLHNVSTHSLIVMTFSSCSNWKAWRDEVIYLIYEKPNKSVNLIVLLKPSSASRLPQWVYIRVTTIKC